MNIEVFMLTGIGLLLFIAMRNNFSLFFIKTKLHIMALSIADFENALTKIDNTTNDIADELHDLRDQIAAGGLTAEQEQSVLTRLDAAANRLSGLAADPENPVPDEGDTTGIPEV